MGDGCVYLILLLVIMIPANVIVIPFAMIIACFQKSGDFLQNFERNRVKGLKPFHDFIELFM